MNILYKLMEIGYAVLGKMFTEDITREMLEEALWHEAIEEVKK